ncbi:MAG: hypothetical protein ACOYCA_03075 [Eggerthellaceae bacterium]|jgi:hypothetical protein
MTLFGDFIAGNPLGFIAVVSNQTISAQAKNAIESSAEALGYGSEACVYITLNPTEASAPLDTQARFVLMEGLDPVCIIVLDSDAATQLGLTYRKTLRTDAVSTVFGRPTLVFTNFEGNLETPEKKQRAWALLKQLPRHER